MKKEVKCALSSEHEYACLVIGDEILDGHVQESNVGELVSALSKKGYVLKEVRVISDDVHEIACALTALRQRYSFVVSTGGIGPTHDDRTLEGYALSFDYETVLHDKMFEYCTHRPLYTPGKRKAAEKMSTMPYEVEVIQLDENWPLLKLHNCYAMPGIPHVCLITIEKLLSILPKQELRKYVVYYLNVHEHAFAEWLRDIAEKYAEHVSVGSYPVDKADPLLKKGVCSKISLTSSGDTRRTLSQFEKCKEETVDYITSRAWNIELDI